MKRLAIPIALMIAWLVAAPPARAADEKDHAEIAKALKAGTIPLQRGITASTKEGKPISAKYELEGGKLQLSVYTMKRDSFSEVLVDPKTGKITKTEKITSGDDLAAAKAQSEAMTKAKRSLDAAASAAMKENSGFHVVSVIPALKDGHPVADVDLVKGDEWKTVPEKLE
jgi:uncharacterized membrane protein YkoI